MALCSVIGFGSAPASADDSLEKLKAQGYATIGIANEPPFSEVKSDGTPTGAAPDVVRAVLKKLCVSDVRYQIVDYGAMSRACRRGVSTPSARASTSIRSAAPRSPSRKPTCAARKHSRQGG